MQLRLPTWPQIEAQIHTAFGAVQLEDGIGYFEAGAKDDYLDPDSTTYLQAWEADERFDWMALYTQFKGLELDPSRHCFMDAKGLRFFLPVLFLRQDPILNSILHFYISAYFQRPGYLEGHYRETISLLSAAQKHCIFLVYDFLTRSGHPEFQEADLNAAFATGEIAMKGFDFMNFIKSDFDENA